jgi:arylsulfatase A-like enzyme
MKNKYLRRTVYTALPIFLLGLLAYIFRKSLILLAVSTLVHLTRDVAENRPITWERGPRKARVPAGKRPPNIILILADDLGHNDISAYGGGAGNGTVKTPAIDSLRRDGVTFTSNYAGMATCAPSRATILSGRYSTRFGFEFTPVPSRMPQVIGMFDDDPRLGNLQIIVDDAAATAKMEEQGMPGSEITVAELLKKQKYHTIHIGKWHLGRSREMLPNAQGFDESLMMASGLYLPVDHPDVVNWRSEFDPMDKFLWATMQHAVMWNGGEWFEPDGYLTDYFTDEAVKAIEANKNRPFFLYLAHWTVHTPLQALRSDYDRFPHIESEQERVYAAMIHSLDRSVQRILDELKRHDLEDNTLVIFTSDNGGAGYIDIPSVNEPFRGWKITLFEGGLRVPLLLKWPDGIGEKGRDISVGVTHHVDLLPTIAGAAGAPLPEDRRIDGVDLVRAANGDHRQLEGRVLCFRDGGYQSVIADGWKLQRNAILKKKWLFHIAVDPTEQKNVIASHPRKVEELEALLERHNEEQVPPLYPALIHAPVSIDKVLGQSSYKDEIIYWSN